MVNILRCSPELLDFILKHVSTVDRLALSLANKQMHTRIEPSLYTNIDLDCHRPGDFPLYSFLRTVLENPKLTNHVQCLVLRGRACTTEDFQIHPAPRMSAADFDIAQAEAAIRATGLPHLKDWVQALYERKSDAVVALLLSQLPALEKLSLASKFICETELTGFLFKYALLGAKGYSIPSFDNLKEVYYEPNEEIDPITYDRHCHGDVLPFFYLPAIQHLTLPMNASPPCVWPTKLPSPSMLTYLNVDLVQEEQLFHILSVTKNLETLRWCWYHDPPADEDLRPETRIVDLDIIIEALMFISSTLTDLSIYGLCGRTSQFRPFGVRLRGSWKAMVHFDRLKRLEAPIPFFIGFIASDTLMFKYVVPKNVEKLVLNDGFSDNSIYDWDEPLLAEPIEWWLSHYKEGTPNLRTLEIRLLMAERFWEPYIFRGMEEAAVRNGVEFKMIISDIIARRDGFVEWNI